MSSISRSRLMRTGLPPTSAASWTAPEKAGGQVLVRGVVHGGQEVDDGPGYLTTGCAAIGWNAVCFIRARRVRRGVAGSCSQSHLSFSSPFPPPTPQRTPMQERRRLPPARDTAELEVLDNCYRRRPVRVQAPRRGLTRQELSALPRCLLDRLFQFVSRYRAVLFVHAANIAGGQVLAVQAWRRRRPVAPVLTICAPLTPRGQSGRSAPC